MDQHVIDNSDEARFEVFQGDQLAGFARYHRFGNEIAFIHTEIFPAFEGKGLASVLARTALDQARERGLAVLPYCPFIRRWISKHPDYVDLVPTTHRARFEL
ncbi:GNAT family N-acetyltransferase [Streptacidiphilus fuscans]|uniref:N-acetyltransferase n=1 Tax=Streptacidiphilus fuscans TaxID=2789292 RepID=A0A931B0I4_9ACTN|nr:GNAT family N-acetyltransferase [Streptacidiphilus fuscans]MBF9066691.1 N-acetyltransferase [Streptacidiphilus fuscans]